MNVRGFFRRLFGALFGCQVSAPIEDPYAGYAIKVGRKIMRPTQSGWHAYAEQAGHHDYHHELEKAPDDLKRWDAAPHARRIEATQTVFAPISDLKVLLTRVEVLVDEKTPEPILRQRLRELRHQLQETIYAHGAKNMFCDAHHGPAPHSLFTKLSDGRTLCECCYQQHLEEQSRNV